MTLEDIQAEKEANRVKREVNKAKKAAELQEAEALLQRVGLKS